MSKRSKVGLVVLGALVLASAAVGFWAMSPADLRTAVSRDPTPENRARGRRLLEEAAAAHGRATYETHTTLTLEATDDWSATRLGSMSSWWQPDRQRLRHELLLRTFTSRMTLLDGPEQGTQLAVQAFETFVGDPPVRTEEADERTQFYLPTLQYFTELPFRLLEAPLVTYAGEGTYDGRAYERVLVTWDTFEPNADVDQYDVWIDPVTQRYHSVRYTLRDAFPAAAGTILFEDYTSHDGILVAHRQTVVLDAQADITEALETSFLHRLTVDRVALDEVAAEDLAFDASLESADAKP